MTMDFDKLRTSRNHRGSSRKSSIVMPRAGGRISSGNSRRISRPAAKVVSKPQFVVTNKTSRPRRRTSNLSNTAVVVRNTRASKQSRSPSGRQILGKVVKGIQGKRRNGNRKGNRRNQGKKQTPTTADQLDKQLDSYWARDEDAMKQKMDSELESYYNTNNAPQQTEATAQVTQTDMATNVPAMNQA